jgi:hypothetical protein
MVDTSRGYADLKALFPDNQSRAIHPQGIRDIIESVAHPVRGGGMDEAHVTQSDAFSLYVWNQSISVPHNATTYFSLDPTQYLNYLPNDADNTNVLFYDPLGLGAKVGDVHQDPNHSFLNGGKYLKNIPQGSVWVPHFTWRFTTGTFVATDDVSAGCGYPLPPMVFPVNWQDDTAGGIWGAPMYAYTGEFQGKFAMSNHNVFTTLPVPVVYYKNNKFSGPWTAYAPSIWQTSGETQTVDFFQFDFWRIA